LRLLASRSDQYSNSDILFAFHDDDFDGWVVLVVDAVALDDGAEGVFEELEAGVGAVAGDVGECGGQMSWMGGPLNTA
jgi:hypothetical protein